MPAQYHSPEPEGQCEKCIGSNEQCQFSERFLQILWNEKMLIPDLHCSDGSSLRIVCSGNWNTAAGPDFSHAVLLLGSELRRGDVEIHRRSSDWFRHGHQHDPAYQQVILHVVWQNDLPPDKVSDKLKTLEISQHLLPSWQRLLSDVEEAFYPYARQVPPGSCALQWALLDNQNVSRVLQTAALARFAGKGQRLWRQCAESGFSQTLYQEIFAGLGYANNREPFRFLAENARLTLLQRFPDLAQRRAVMFGLAGLLPDPTREPVLPEFEQLLQEYWHYWWGSGLQNLKPGWQRGGGRPYNSCQRRLQAGVLWLEKVHYDPGCWLKQLLRQAQTCKQLLACLLDFPGGDSLWQSSRDFAHALRPAAVLLGQDRARDLVMNVLLPLAAVWAEQEEGEHSAMAKLARQAWLELPPSQENHLLKEACHRFLLPPSRAREILKKAYHQQGLLDIYQNFCLALDHDCASCPFTSSANKQESAHEKSAVNTELLPGNIGG